MTVIADLAGASVRHMAPGVISTAQKRTRLEEDHYPETAKKYGAVAAGLHVDFLRFCLLVDAFLSCAQGLYHSGTARLCCDLQPCEAHAG